MTNSYDLIARTENDKVLKSFLERYFFNIFRGKGRLIEFFVRASCPSKCSYCYLQQHQDELYPRELEDNDTILKNSKALLNFYSENKFRADIEIFSGRLFYDDLGFDLLQLFYDHFKDEIFYKPNDIIIPDDMQFLLDDAKVARVEHYISLFKSIDINILISMSIDGKKVDYLRFGARADEFYDKARDFAVKHTFNLHPMVSATHEDLLIENIDWWYDWAGELIDRTMFLEVRNDNWTPSRLDKFAKYIDHIISREIDRLGSEDFYNTYVLGDAGGIDHHRRLIELNSFSEVPNSGLSCALQTILSIRMGDLAILPCHRTCYPHFVAGHFGLDEDGEINSITSINPAFLFAVNAVSLSNLPKCQDCAFNKACLGPCLGSNYESTGDVFYPPESVCNQQKTLIYLVVSRYYQLGFLDKLRVDSPSKFYAVLEILKELIKDSSPEAKRAIAVCSKHHIVSSEKDSLPEKDILPEKETLSEKETPSKKCTDSDECIEKEIRNVFSKFSL